MALNISRKIKDRVERALNRGKSILLLGPRQTGKTTLLASIAAAKRVNLILPRTRAQYEADPERLLREIAGLPTPKGQTPLITIDEIQLVPELLDVCQHMIDQKLAQFILSGSSARKIKARADLNLLPGRVVYLRLDPLCLDEFVPLRLEDELYFGALPGLVQVKNKEDKTEDLRAYVETYLEEEIRKETQIRNLASFSKFLSIAASSSGQICNYSNIANQCGVTSVTVQSYYQVLEDCLICERITPLTSSVSRKRLTKSPRYFFFDLGVRRIAAGEGESLGQTAEGLLFEQFVCLQLLRKLHLTSSRAKIHFWNDPSGPEVDLIIQSGDSLIPIEVKLTASPSIGDAKHLRVFMREYPKAKRGYVICQAEDEQILTPNIQTLHWKNMYKIFE